MLGIATSVLFLALGQTSSGECVGSDSLKRMATAQSHSSLRAMRLSANSPYRVQLAYALRESELNERRSQHKTDLSLLRILPAE